MWHVSDIDAVLEQLTVKHTQGSVLSISPQFSYSILPEPLGAQAGLVHLSVHIDRMRSTRLDHPTNRETAL